jgi:uncharacterized membrane protein YccC
MDDDALTGVPRGLGFLAGLSCCLAAVLAVAFHFPDPSWAPISAWLVSNADPDAVRKKGAYQVLGTIAGAILGYWVATLTIGRPFAQAGCVFAITAIGTCQRFRSAHTYSWLFATIIFLSIVAQSLTPPVALYAVARFTTYQVALGVLTAALVHGVIGPLAGIVGLTKSLDALGESVPGAISPADLIKVSLVAAISATVIPALWTGLNLPSMSQSLVTAIILIDPNALASRRRKVQRLLGCLIGGSAGFLGCICSGDSFFLWISFLVGGTMILSRIYFRGGNWSYAGKQGGIAFIMTLVNGFGPPTDITPVLDRIVGILLGIVVVTMVSLTVHFITDRRGLELAAG